MTTPLLPNERMSNPLREAIEQIVAHARLNVVVTLDLSKEANDANIAYEADAILDAVINKIERGNFTTVENVIIFLQAAKSPTNTTKEVA